MKFSFHNCVFYEIQYRMSSTLCPEKYSNNKKILFLDHQDYGILGIEVLIIQEPLQSQNLILI